VLRSFRDGYLRSQPEGEAEIAEYYAVAPRIVEAIRSNANAVEVFDAIYRELVLPCTTLIDHSDYEKSHELYRSHVQKLKELYCSKEA
jgi:hypothetical protein